ncbi:MAG: hypothetical protein ACPLZD_10790 [Candidatus Saccharicenans sp.]|nr:MAG: hypothetical protein C0168_11205 [Candidatus Aminicenantes bacterium]HEK85931.1 hypothetical protein [Candidatus Aminicenantes bacterium]
MAGTKKILLEVLSIINNNYKEKELEDLILALVNLIMPAIHKSKRYFQLSSYEPQDIAFLTVSTLFVRDKQNRFPVLERLFNWKIIEKFLSANEADFERYLKNILYRRLKQTFYYLRGEITPERNKIRREILYSLKKNRGFKLKKIGEQYVVSFRPENGKSHSSAIITDEKSEQLLSICLNYGLGGLQVPKFFQKLAQSLSQNGVKIEISLQQLSEIYIETQRNYLQTEAHSASHLEKRYAFSEFQKNLSRWIKELQENHRFLLKRYLLKNKIRPEEMEAYLQALDDLILDWQDGGQEKPLFAYLKKYLPDLSPENYRREQRKILEYLVRNAKNFFKNRLESWNSF